VAIGPVRRLARRSSASTTFPKSVPERRCSRIPPHKIDNSDAAQFRTNRPRSMCKCASHHCKQSSTGPCCNFQQFRITLLCITAVPSLIERFPVSFEVHMRSKICTVSNKAGARQRVELTLIHSKGKLETIAPIDPDVVIGHRHQFESLFLSSRSLSLVIHLPGVFL